MKQTKKLGKKKQEILHPDRFIKIKSKKFQKADNKRRTFLILQFSNKK